jgi:hypothetical protein
MAGAPWIAQAPGENRVAIRPLSRSFADVRSPNHPMKSRTGFLFLASVAAIAVGWVYWRRAGPEQTPEKPPVMAERPPASPAEPAKADPAPGLTAKADAPEAASKPKSADPDRARRQAQKQLARTAERYAGLLAELNLPPDQQAAFIQLLTDRRQTTRDAVGALVESGQDPAADPASFQAGLLSNRDDLEGRIRTLLGDDNYAQYRAYSLNLGQQGTVQRVQTLLADQAEPLTAEQTAQLNAAMTNHGTGHLNADILQEAQAFLSPTQLAALAVIAEEQSTAAKRTRAERQVVTKGP